MNAIAITGADSFIGQHLIRLLAKCSDVQLKALIHENNKSNLCNTDNTLIIKGNLLQQETLGGFVSPGCTVVNLVYLNTLNKQKNLAAMDNLGKACAEAKVKRLIHCSTVNVVGRVAGNIVNEETECNPIDQYEITKLAIEKLLIEKYGDLFEIIILRPTAVFGPGGKNLLKLAQSLVQGNQVINYFKSCLFSNRRMNLVSVENVVSAIEFLVCYKKKSRKPEIFIVSDDEHPSNNYRDVELSLMHGLKNRDYMLPIVPIPFFVLRYLLKFAGRTNSNPTTVYSCQKLLEAGFEKTVSFKNSLDHFVSWYKLNFIDEQWLHN